jgi:hypothetical protein
MSDTPRTDTNKHALDHLERYGYENSLDDPVVEWPILCEEIEHELTKAKEQRDRLADALESVMAHFSDIAGDCNDEAQREEELKSTELAEQALAAVKGGTQ